MEEAVALWIGVALVFFAGPAFGLGRRTERGWDKSIGEWAWVVTLLVIGLLAMIQTIRAIWLAL